MELYFYVENGEQAGPVSPEEFAAHGIKQGTLVWKQGMADWATAGSLPELEPYLAPQIPLGDDPVAAPEAVTDTTPYATDPELKPKRPVSTALLVGTIITLVLFGVMGIPALVYWCRSNASWKNGNYEHALNMAKKSRTWFWIGLGIGIVLLALYFLFFFYSIAHIGRLSYY